MGRSVVSVLPGYFELPRKEDIPPQVSRYGLAFLSYDPPINGVLYSRRLH